MLVVNQQFADIFQSDALFLNGKLLSAFSSSLYADFELALEKFATGEKQVDFEFYSKGHFYLSYFKAMYSADQQINAVILVCADVTRLKRREKVLLLNNQKLGEFKHEVRQFQKPYDNQQAEQTSLMV